MMLVIYCCSHANAGVGKSVVGPYTFAKLTEIS